MKIDAVISGGASNCVGLASALYELAKKREIARIGGTSAGSICAMAYAFGIPEAKIKYLLEYYLTKDRLLDGSIFNVPSGFGFCSGKAFSAALESVIDKKATLGDAKIPVFVVVTDMYQAKPVILSSWNSPKVSAIEAVVASSSLLPIFCARPITGANTGNRLYFDGGFAKNFAMDVFDDVPDRPTIGLRIKTADSIEPVRQWEFLKAAKAVARTMLYSSDNAHMSDKHTARIIDVEGRDGLDFSLTKDEFDLRWLLGKKASFDNVQL